MGVLAPAPHAIEAPLSKVRLRRVRLRRVRLRKVRLRKRGLGRWRPEVLRIHIAIVKRHHPIVCTPWPEAVAYSSGCDPAFAMAQPSNEPGLELRMVKKLLVTRLQRLKGRVKTLDE